MSARDDSDKERRASPGATPSRRPVILVVQPVLAHYRRSLFTELAETEDQCWLVAGGEGGFGVQTCSPGHPGISSSLRNRFVRVGGHRLVWQSGLLPLVRRTRPDAVVLTGVDPHLVSNLVVCLLAGWLGTRVIWWGHGTWGGQGRLGRWVRKAFFRRAIGIFTYGEDARADLISHAVAEPGRVVTLNNCINEEDYGFRGGLEPGTRPGGNGLGLLFSGRLTASKRADLVVEAVALLKQRGVPCHCDVVGDGPELPRLKALTQERGAAGDVRFHGPLYGDAVREVFSRADLFVLPGKVGLSVIHSLSYGLPVITVGRREVHSPEVEILTPGETGGFFRNLTAVDLADEIAGWAPRLARDREAIRQRCVRAIVDRGYLPGPMAGRMRQAARTWLAAETHY